ncbi:MAG: hypothetical protein WB562_09255 [Candidatus Sulfotelmatobacter sp.]
MDGKDKFVQKVEIKAYFDQFLQQGRPSYTEILKVPSNERISSIANIIGGVKTLKILSIPITECLTAAGIENMDLVINIASQIIDEAPEDNLSIQDLFIFTKGFISGKYSGKDGVTTYGKLTQISFMDKLEIYRQERYEAIMNYRYEQSVQYKSLGPSERTSDNPDSQEDMREAMKQYLSTKINTNE